MLRMRNELRKEEVGGLWELSVQIVKGKGYIVDLFSPIIAIVKVKHVSGEVNIN